MKIGYENKNKRALILLWENKRAKSTEKIQESFVPRIFFFLISKCYFILLYFYAKISCKIYWKK